MGFGETVVVEGPGSDARCRAASKCETSLLSNYPNAGADRFMRRRITVDAREKD